MVNVDEAVIARLKSHGATFEIMVDCKNAISIKEGKELDMADVLAAEKVFSDAKKGLPSPDAQLTQVFGSTDPIDVAKQIISKGEIQLTAEYRSELREQKKKQILAAIARNAVDPRTGLPHPLTRVESAFEQSKAKVDEFQSVERQIQDVIKAMRATLPIKFEKRRLSIKIPAEVASKAFGAFSGMGDKISESWNNDGSYSCLIEIPAGMQEQFFDKLNSATHGNNHVEIVKD